MNRQPKPQIMNYATNLPTQYSNHVALVQPQSQPQHKEYDTNAAITHSSYILLLFNWFVDPDISLLDIMKSLNYKYGSKL